VFDLEYLGVGKDLPEQQLSEHYSKERRDISRNYRQKKKKKKKKNIIKVILKKE
jgi:IS4 transposase